MKAAVLYEYGSEEQVRYVKHHPIPTCKHGDVLIKVKACALSHFDHKVRMGGYSNLTQPCPFVTGYEISGIVQRIGPGVSHVATGDEVVALSPLDNNYGGCAEYSLQQASHLVAKPDLLTHEEACSGLMSGVRAFTALHYHLQLKPGQFLLFFPPPWGADGLVVQLAAHIGAKVIVAVANSEALNLFGDCGTHVVRVIDVTSESLIDAVLEETGHTGVHTILDYRSLYSLDNVFSETKIDDYEGDKGAQHSDTQYTSQKELIRCLGVGGRWCSSNPSLQLDPPDSAALFLRGGSLSFVFEQTWLLAPQQHGKLLHMMNEILCKASTGALKPALCKLYPLEKIRQAHRDIINLAVGKVIIKM